ncbi:MULTISPECIES: hypothetical protein [Flavobacterium]|uniref:Lipocalin-like domain-containing protein n=1 Tax=Flavobacterium jumunjinense TaxID=998845 RepID=A0ABV5GUA2_9FLAO|nr:MULTISPECIES: hypothetical protein [Flavobacterium]
MKLTNIFIYTIGFITLIACETNERKNNLIGIWESYETQHTKVVLIFYKDSVITEYLGGGMHTNSRWSIDDKKIYLKNVRLKDTILKDELNYEYQLNKTKDSLFVKVENGNQDDYSKMRRVEKNPFDELN